MAAFIDRLATAVCLRQTPVLVGLDPRWERLPPSLRKSATAKPKERARAYVDFCRGVVDAVAGLVPAIKPQMAFFEQLGAAGILAMKDVVAHAHAQGLIVILDGKRNDIGSTAEAYADGLLGAGQKSQGGGDALTVSPYLGNDGLEPFVRVATDREAGVFVLVKTSNPGGKQFQDLVADGRPLYRHVAEYVEELAGSTLGQCGYGSVGAVVGATFPEQLDELRLAMPRTWFLVPGFGSQGGTAADVGGAFDEQGLGAIVNNSRGILFAYERSPYRERFGETQWQEAVEAATRDMIDALRAETRAGKLVGADSE